MNSEVNFIRQSRYDIVKNSKKSGKDNEAKISKSKNRERYMSCSYSKNQFLNLKSNMNAIININPKQTKENKNIKDINQFAVLNIAPNVSMVWNK